MIAVKRREEFKVKINDRLENEFKISISPVRSVGDLIKKENFVGALKPSNKSVRIGYRISNK